jgi:hypothetical protein
LAVAFESAAVLSLALAGV